MVDLKNEEIETLPVPVDNVVSNEAGEAKKANGRVNRRRKGPGLRGKRQEGSDHEDKAEETKDSADVVKPTAPKQKARGPRPQRAPRVEEKLEDGQEAPERKSDLSKSIENGTGKLKISNARPRVAYTRLCRLMLAGLDGSGEKLKIEGSVERVELAALGAAIGSAIFIGDSLTKGGVCEYDSVSTEYLDIGATKDGRVRKAPRIIIVLKKLDSWNPEEDQVLKGSRVFRKKVLEGQSGEVVEEKDVEEEKDASDVDESSLTHDA